MNEEIGIENIKSALKEVIEVGMTVAKATADGKITFAEGVAIAWEAKDLVGIYKRIPEIKKEYENLETNDLEELKQYVAETFELDNDKTEEIIEKSFNLIIAIVELVKVL